MMRELPPASFHRFDWGFVDVDLGLLLKGAGGRRKEEGGGGFFEEGAGGVVAERVGESEVGEGEREWEWER